MAILKKKMAGKPAMMKRKAKDGDEVKTVERGETAEVKKRQSAGEELKGFYKRDFLKADSAKTKTGNVLRKAGNTAIKAAFTPQALMASAMRIGGPAKANKEDMNKIPEKKMGGKMKKYQAGGVVGKQPKAKMVDPKGAFTKVQKRTLAKKK